MAMAVAGNCSSDLTPSLETSMCLGCKKEKKKAEHRGFLGDCQYSV